MTDFDHYVARLATALREAGFMVTVGGLTDANGAGAVAGASDRTLRSWRGKGEGPPFIRLPGGEVRYLIADLLIWLSMARRGYLVDYASLGSGRKNPEELNYSRVEFASRLPKMEKQRAED